MHFRSLSLTFDPMSILGLSFLLTVIPFTSTLVIDFKPFSITDIDTTLGDPIGKHNLHTCFVECSAKGDACIGLHQSSDGVCRLVSFSHRWQKKSLAPPMQFWMPISKSKCSAADFSIVSGRSTYLYQRTPQTWIGAMFACEARNSKLAELTTTEEALFISQEIRKVLGKDGIVHVGLKQKPGSEEPRGGWIWYSSEKPFSGTWVKHNPNNYANTEHWGIMRTKSSAFEDVSVDSQRHYICECNLD